MGARAAGRRTREQTESAKRHRHAHPPTREDLQRENERLRREVEDLQRKVAEREQQIGEAEKQIAATRETAMGNVRGIAADAASAIVQRLTGVLPDGNTLNSAVDASLKG